MASASPIWGRLGWEWLEFVHSIGGCEQLDLAFLGRIEFSAHALFLSGG